MDIVDMGGTMSDLRDEMQDLLAEHVRLRTQLGVARNLLEAQRIVINEHDAQLTAAQEENARLSALVEDHMQNTEGA